MQVVALAHPADIDGFRAALRSLVAAGTAPDAVCWQVGGTTSPPLAPAPPLAVPRRLAELAPLVVCHRDPQRFNLLHRAALRLPSNRSAFDDPANPLARRVEAMATDVAHDLEALRAGLAFRETGDTAGPLLHATARPVHHVLRACLGPVIRCMADRRWTIATADETAHWDGEALHFLPGVPLPDDPAADLARLRAEAGGCTRCPLHGPATQTVFGEGPPDARLMIVGEQPGDQEDLAGRPFVGPAGQLLDQCLAAAGIDRSRAYVTNAVKHFKFTPTARRRLHQSPSPAEITACRRWLDQERALVRPALVLMLGASAAQALLGRPVAVGRERGRLLKLPDGAPAFLTVHPSFLLRIDNPGAAAAERARFVADLRAAQALAG